MFGPSLGGKIKAAETVVGEEDAPVSVGLRARAQADGQAGKGAADEPGLAAEGDDTGGAHENAAGTQSTVVAPSNRGVS